jgi:hypothetical protein
MSSKWEVVVATNRKFQLAIVETVNLINVVRVVVVSESEVVG